MDPRLLDTSALKIAIITRCTSCRLCLFFVYLGIATMVASFFEVAMFMWSGTRQVSRLRQRFLEASLKQEQAYYEVHATSGDVLSGLNEDCNAVQAAIRCVACS